MAVDSDFSPAASPPGTGGPVARDILADWANEQESWVRSVVVRVLAAGSELDGQQVADCLNECLLEKRLAEGEFTPALPILREGADGRNLDDLQLLCLRDVRGVNALASDQEITFGQGLTLIYGENAAGKSGYVRILKRAAAVRNIETILPDVSRTSSAPMGATIEVRLGGRERQLVWRGEAGVEPLTRLAIFDTKAVALHVDDELTYHYTPADLALFKFTHNAIAALRKLLQTEIGRRRPRNNPFLSEFQKGTVVYPDIETLGATTELHQLEQLAKLTAAEESELSGTRFHAPIQRARVDSDRAVLAESQLKLLNSVHATCRDVAACDFPGYAQALAAVDAARAAQRRAAADLFAGVSADHVSTPEWSALIAAGEEYIHHLGRPDYPHEGDDCIYCRQPLSDPALNLIRNYRTYVNDTLANQLADAEQRRSAVSESLLEVPTARVLAELEGLRDTFGGQPELTTALHQAHKLLEDLQRIQATVQMGDHVDAAPLVHAAVALMPILEGFGTAINETVRLFRADAAGRDKLLRQYTARSADLEARTRLRAKMSDIRAYVHECKWAHHAELLCGNHIRQILRNLTGASKLAGEQLLNQNFVSRFEAECTALRAPEKVRLDFCGRKGVPARRKSVFNTDRPSIILSEGEQKVIALADFLAEASLRPATVPLVFDDPVTSLDYRHLNEVVDRLYELSQATQVIVFTHSIMLASGLLGKFDHGGDRHRCKYYLMTAESNRKGIVAASEHPRSDTPKQTGRDINLLLGDAEKASGPSRRILVERGYDLIRNWIESFIEKDMLADVVQRYNPHIGVTKLGNIRIDRLHAAVAEITVVYEKACRYIPSHSQPLETLGIAPTLEELRADWVRLEAIRRRFQAET